MSGLVQGELPLNVDVVTKQSTQTDLSEQVGEVGPDEVKNELSERQFKMAMAKAYKERNDKIKENKEMLANMELEVRYYKAKRDLTVHRYESMEYYLKNLEIEPRYLAAIETQKAKEEQTTSTNTPILVK